MGDADFKFIVICVGILTLYSSFLIIYAGENLISSPEETPEDKGLIGGIIPDINLDFLNPFNENFNSEFVIINVFIFTPILLILVFVGLRFLRGV